MIGRDNDRGAVGMAVLAPILAAVVGGAAAILTAIQLVSLSPSDDSGPAAQTSSTNGAPSEVQYGGR